MTVNNHYEISPTTLAILPAYHITYQSRIYDLKGEIYCEKPPIKLIEKACLEGGSSFDGRKKALQYKKSFYQCPPIPINPLEDIYAFPTCSPTSHDCIWLFYEHISGFHSRLDSTVITFYNGQSLEVPVSLAVIRNQMARTESCIVSFSKPKKRMRMYYETPSLTSKER
ncbi:competence protein ComK [Bacillus salitolerans]|uniref:Competence protein ComK n=1 Tax=Bacillus salitolerans TaxID=1437434 RepID=A0ABW4LWH6_9BACI